MTAARVPAPSAAAGASHDTAAMAPEKVGSVVGAAFGLVYVLANTASLPGGLRLVLRAVAVLAFVTVLVAALRPGGAGSAAAAGGGPGRGYWIVVAGEVLAIAGGLAALNGPLGAPQAAVAWISCVVGAHFVALALVWRQRLFHVLGAALLVCGLLGLALAVLGSPDAAVDLVAGVIPGAVLLSFGLWGSTTSTAPQPPRSEA